MNFGIGVEANVSILVSIVVSIPACHAGDPGSIPGRGASFRFHCHHSVLQIAFDDAKLPRS